MCGIAGAFKMGSGRITISSLQKIAIGIEKRGPHAWGMSWIDSIGRIHSYKAPGRITEGLFLIQQLKDFNPIGVIMHTRFKTHGSADHNANNHPHPSDGGWFVHNGQIPNWQDLIEEHELMPLTDCDSEVLGLIAQYKEGSLIRRWKYAINQTDRTRPLCMAGLWSRPGRAVLAKRGNPLMMSEGRSGNVYFSSLKEGLPGKPKRAPESTIACFDLNQRTVSHEPLRDFIDTGIKIAGSGAGTHTAVSARIDAGFNTKGITDRYATATTVLDDAADRLKYEPRETKSQRKRARKLHRTNDWD